MQYEWSPEPPQRALAGVAVRRGRLRFSQNADLAGIKHLNRLEQVLARREWSDPEYFESVHLAGSGCLASGTMSNLFLVLGGQLVTPSVDYCGVAGVMRELVLEGAREAGIGTRVDTLAPELLDIAEELFLTNVRIGIVPIVRIGEQGRPAGPLTRRLQDLLIDAR